MVPCVDTQDGSPAGGGAAAVPIVEQGIMVPTIVAATATGSTNVLILNFTGASIQLGPVALASWVTRVNSATLGTTLEILVPGVYVPELGIPWASGQSVQQAVLRAATLAQRTTTGALYLDQNAYGLGVKFASTIQDLARPEPITIDAAMIAAGDNVLSAQVFDLSGGGGPPPAAAYINVADTVWKLHKVA